jgi:hypothetical protein
MHHFSLNDASIAVVRHNGRMSVRTTVTLSDTAQRLVTEYSEICQVSTSRAVSDLIERSSSRKPRIKIVNGLAVFDIELVNGPITTEEVLRLEDESL